MGVEAGRSYVLTTSAANGGTASDRLADQPSAAGSALREFLGPAAVIAAYLMIGIVAFWPAFPGISSHLYGADSADTIQTVWFLNWVPHALAHGLNPYFSNAIYAPTGVNLAQNTATPLLAWITAPFAPILSPVVRANLLMVLAMPISATAAFVVLRQWKVWVPAAAVGGLVYGFSPYMLGQADHLELLFVPLPPFIAMTVASILQNRGSSRREGLQLGLLVVAQYLISPEVLADVAVLTVAAVVFIGIRHPSRVRTMVHDASGAVGIALLVASALLAYPIWMGFFGPQSFAGPATSTTNPFHNDLLSSVIPTGLQQVSLGMRALLPHLNQGAELDGYIGLPVLFVSGFVAWCSRRSPRMQLAVVLTLFVALLSLGPHLSVNGRATGITLPFSVLDHLPLLDSILPDRLSLEVDACLAAVIAFGLDDMRHAPEQSWKRRGSAAFAVVTVAVLVYTQWPVWPTPPVRVSAVALPAAITRAIPVGYPVAITYPYDVGTLPSTNAPMLWQAEDNFGFRLLGGYAFHVEEGVSSPLPYVMKPAGTQLFLANEEGTRIFGPEPALPPLVAITRSVLSQHDVRLVIVDRSMTGSAAVMELFGDVLGPPRLSAGHFSMWDGWHGRLREQFSPTLTTKMILPGNDARLSGTVPLDAVGVSPYPVTRVAFFLSGEGHNDQLIADAHPTSIGWGATWNTTDLANGTYVIQTKSYDEFGTSSPGTRITITIHH